MFGENKAMRRFTTAELRKVVQHVEASVEPVAPPDATPVYDTANLVLCVSDATKRFRRSRSC